MNTSIFSSRRPRTGHRDSSQAGASLPGCYISRNSAPVWGRRCLKSPATPSYAGGGTVEFSLDRDPRIARDSRERPRT
jgi:hypothetical protein